MVGVSAEVSPEAEVVVSGGIGISICSAVGVEKSKGFLGGSGSAQASHIGIEMARIARQALDFIDYSRPKLLKQVNLWVGSNIILVVSFRQSYVESEWVAELRAFGESSVVEQLGVGLPTLFAGGLPLGYELFLGVNGIEIFLQGFLGGGVEVVHPASVVTKKLVIIEHIGELEVVVPVVCHETIPADELAFGDSATRAYAGR